MSSAPAPSSSSTGSPRGALGVVFVTVFMDLVGFGIVIPLLPQLATHFSASPTTVTWVSGVFSLMQFLFAPLVGKLSDRVGRRPVLLFTVAMNALGYLLFGLAGSIAMLFVARIVSGLGSANIATAQAVISDLTTAENRAKGMGIIGAAFGLGFIFGPAIGGLLAPYLGLSGPAFVAAALCTLNFVSAFFLLRESRAPSLRSRSSRPPLPLVSIGVVLELRDGWRLLWIFLFYSFGFSLMEQVLGLFINVAFVGGGLDEASLARAATLTAYFLIVAGVTSSVVQGMLIGRLVRLAGERRLMLVGAVLVAVAIGALPILGSSASFHPFQAAAFFIAGGSALLTPSLTALLSQSAPVEQVGEALGVGQSLSALGRVLAPAVAGMLFELDRAVPFWGGAALVGSCALVAATLRPAPARLSSAVP